MYINPKSKPARRLEDDYNIVASALQSGEPEPGSGIIAIQDVRGGTRDRTDSGQGIGIDTSGGPMYTLSKTEQHAVAFAENQRGGTGQGHNTNYVSSQAYPDRMREAASLPRGMDSPRYRALGNAVTVSVARWIAERLLRAL